MPWNPVESAQSPSAVAAQPPAIVFRPSRSATSARLVCSQPAQPRTDRGGILTIRDSDADPLRRWAIQTIAAWLGVKAVSCAPDATADIDLSDAAGRSARVWMPTDLAGAAAAFERGAALLKSGAEPDPPAGQPWPFDLASVVSWLLRLEDGRGDATRDVHGRLPDERTAVARAGLADVPVCHVWAEQLARALARRGWRRPAARLWPGGKTWAVALTHDVDLPQKHDVMARLQLARAMFGQHRAALAVRQLGAAACALVNCLAGRRDRSWCFDEWTAAEERLGIRSTWCFAAIDVGRPGASLHDVRYRISDRRYRRLMARLAQCGFEIALHAGYNAARDPEAPTAQRAALTAILNRDVAGVRHHFWRLCPDDPNRNWAAHVRAGLRYDMSVAFTNRIGFRCGAALPYKPLGADVDFHVLPTTVMDASLLRGNTPDAAVAAAIAHLKTCRRYGLCAVLDWHAETWHDSPAHPGFGEAARRIYDWLAEQSDVWVAPAGEIINAFSTI